MKSEAEVNRYLSDTKQWKSTTAHSISNLFSETELVFDYTEIFVFSEKKLSTLKLEINYLTI